jgi:hypothetical protein
MQVITSVDDALSVTDPGIRKLLQLRFNQLCGNETDTMFYLVDSTDEIEELEDATGCPIITSWFTNAVYPDDNFAPCFEFVEEHRCCFEMVFILNDDSSAVVLLIPKLQAIDALLLRLCSEFASEVTDAGGVT